MSNADLKSLLETMLGLIEHQSTRLLDAEQKLGMPAAEAEFRRNNSTKALAAIRERLRALPD